MLPGPGWWYSARGTGWLAGRVIGGPPTRGRGWTSAPRHTFASARMLYQSAGFVPCGPFADYQPSEDKLFMMLEFD